MGMDYLIIAFDIEEQYEQLSIVGDKASEDLSSKGLWAIAY